MGATKSAPAPPPSNDAWNRVRHLRVERADGRDEFINIARINAYYKNKIHTATNGITFPPYPPFDWRNANNEDNLSFAHTQASSHAHVQLDFGMNGVPVDKIHIAFRQENTDWNTQRRIGTRLVVQDWQGKILFSYKFDHSSLNESVFVYPKQVPSDKAEPVKNAWRAIRSMRIERADGKEEYINVARMNAYIGERKHVAIDGQCSPPYPPFTWQNANNESDIDTSIAHTGKSADAFVHLDFGEQGINVDRFYIGFRKVTADWNKKRRIGTRLVVKDTEGKNVIQHTFNEDPGDVIEFKYPSTVPVNNDAVAPMQTIELPPLRLESIPDLPRNLDTKYGEIVLTAFLNDTPERIAAQRLNISVAPDDDLLEKAIVELIKTRPNIRQFGVQNGGEVWYDFKTTKSELVNPNTERARNTIRDNRDRPLGGPWLMAVYSIPDQLHKQVHDMTDGQPATQPKEEKTGDTVLPDGFDKESYDAWLGNFVEHPSLAKNGKIQWLFYQLADTVCGVANHTNRQKAFIERFADVCSIDPHHRGQREPEMAAQVHVARYIQREFR